MDAVEKTQLAIAYALKTILAERAYELAEEEACSAREVKEAVVAETAEPGLGANCPAGDWVPFVPDVSLQGFDSCVLDGEIGPICACVCAGSQIWNRSEPCGVALSYGVLHWNVEAELVQSMAVVVVAELDATGLSVTTCRALVGQNLWFRPCHHHRKTETHRTTWLRPAT